ncbi:MAG: gamma-glutamyltransferase [Kiloniellales bacterium]|nr:gamma-glutamyltransferase [Kiloniellales bacterium]
MLRFGFLFLLILLLPGQLSADQAILSPRDIFHPVFGAQGMVATQEATATRIGLDVLKRGGNAVDAAVAVGFALAVTLPRAGNLGGGGFMLIHMAEAGETLALDYREEAPAAAGRDLFLGAEGPSGGGQERHGVHAVPAAHRRRLDRRLGPAPPRRPDSRVLRAPGGW